MSSLLAEYFKEMVLLESASWVGGTGMTCKKSMELEERLLNTGDPSTIAAVANIRAMIAAETTREFVKELRDNQPDGD